jgi:hypothetical protein
MATRRVEGRVSKGITMDDGHQGWQVGKEGCLLMMDFASKTYTGTSFRIWRNIGVTGSARRKSIIYALCSKILTVSLCTQATLRTNPYEPVSKGSKQILLEWLN